MLREKAAAVRGVREWEWEWRSRVPPHSAGCNIGSAAGAESSVALMVM